MLHSPLIILGLVGVSKTFHVYIFATIRHFSRWAIPDNKGTPLLRRILLKKQTKKQDSNEVGYAPPRQISFRRFTPQDQNSYPQWYQ